MVERVEVLPPKLERLVLDQDEFFASDRLNTYDAGPRSDPLPALPWRKGCWGAVYAAGLNQSDAFGFDTFGSPTISGRK